MMHIITIQPLLFSLAVPSLAVGGQISVIFLMPTFILYIAFSSADADKVHVIFSSDDAIDLLSALQNKKEDNTELLLRGSGNDEYSKDKGAKVFDYIINT